MPLNKETNQGLSNRVESIYKSSVLIQDIAWKTFRERWTIETNGERASRKSVLGAGQDDDDDNCLKGFITSHLKAYKCMQIKRI